MAEFSTTAAPEPVTAEIVPPAPSPWRFGLRAMFGLMAVCSVQFALMSYLGVCLGVGIGLLVCVAVFAFLFLVGMFLPGRDSRLLPAMDVMVVRSMLAIVVLLFGTILAGGGTAAYQAAVRIRTEQLVERGLGMSLTRQMLVNKNEVQWGLVITGVKEGGVAHQAGLRKDEVIVVSGTIDDFYQMLYANRGKDVDINVATGALGGASLDTCPQRSVTLPVPK